MKSNFTLKIHACVIFKKYRIYTWVPLPLSLPSPLFRPTLPLSSSSLLPELLSDFSRLFDFTDFCVCVPLSLPLPLDCNAHNWQSKQRPISYEIDNFKHEIKYHKSYIDFEKKSMDIYLIIIILMVVVIISNSSIYINPTIVFWAHRFSKGDFLYPHTYYWP